MKSSNLLKYARYVRNSISCRYDVNWGFSAEWSLNGNVNGWDIYENVYMYGAWSGILFGNSYEKECYIQRTYQFIAVPAEFYYTLVLMMRIIPEEGKPHPKTAKVRWITANDDLWNSNKEMEFDLVDNSDWSLYAITLGESKWYQGDISNLRVYPFIDGHKGCRFEFKYVRLEALDTYKCANTNCDKFPLYSHPCPWTGSYGECLAYDRKEHYSTVEGESDSLIVNIGDYGDEVLTLGTLLEVSGDTIAKALNLRLNEIGVGGYFYAVAEHDDYGRIKIMGGDIGGTVRVTGGSAAEELGFFEGTNFIGTNTDGTSSASGFDYASTKRLTAIEINSLIEGDITGGMAYFHNPEQYTVEAGRADYFKSLTSGAVDYRGVSEFFYNIKAPGCTLIDLSHPFNDSGKVTDIYFNCSKIRDEGATLMIVRPLKDGTFKVIHAFEIEAATGDYVWTSKHTSHHIACDVFVSKGDALAIYNADIHVAAAHATKRINARYFFYRGKISGIFDPGPPIAYGIMGFSWYARSSHRQTSTLLEMDFGARTNIDSLSFTSVETEAEFEYNLASCLDLSWNVDLYGETHTHYARQCSTGYVYTFVHQNIAYGVDCLSDMIRSPDGGQQGDAYGIGSDGITTLGSHAYFYVNGDGEWDYQYECDGKHEFCYPWCGAKNLGFERDPIAFIMEFPPGVSEYIHRTAIYFKEEYNFRHFSLQYYVRDELSSKTGEYVGYHFVPTYKEVHLDSAIITAENADSIDSNKQYKFYFFSNPTPWISTTWDAGGSDLDSFLNYMSIANLQWNTLGHVFEPVRCNGFKIYCDWHKSTKISEMEIYAKSRSLPSLLDNVTLKVSDDGTRWRYVPFEDSPETNTVTAYIKSSPQYALLEITSQLQFKAYGLHVGISNTNVRSDCTDSLMVSSVRPNDFSLTDRVDLENLYGVPCNLYVDIDRSGLQGKHIVAHLVCSGTESLTDALVGPGARLYKQDDYKIYLGEGQVANNCNIYGLRNLIDGKPAYYTDNAYGIWHFYGVLEHNTQVAFETDQSFNDARFTLDTPVYGKTFRVDMLDGASIYYNIDQAYIISYGSILGNYVVYLDANPGLSTHVGYATTIEDGRVQPAVVLHNTYDLGIPDDWVYAWKPGKDFSYFSVGNNKLYCDSIDFNSYIEMYYDFPDNEGPLNYDVDFILGAPYPFPTDLNVYVYLIDDDGFWDYKVQMEHGVSSFYIYASEYTLTAALTKARTASLSAVEYSIKISKRGNSVVFSVGSTTASYTSGSLKRIKRIKILITNEGATIGNYRDLYFKDFKVTVFPVLSRGASIVFDCADFEEVDMIRFYTFSGDINALSISTADITGSFSLMAVSATTTENLSIPYYNNTFPICMAFTGDFAGASFNENYSLYNSYTQGTSDMWVGYYFESTPRAINRCEIYQHYIRYMEIQASNTPGPDWNSRLWITLATASGTIDGWNTITFSNTTKYKYYRVFAPYIPINYITTWVTNEIWFKTTFDSALKTGTSWNDPVEYAFAIDLGRRYDIDIIRNYGLSSTHEVGIKSPEVSYSNSAVANIDSVNWDGSSTYVLLHFDAYADGYLVDDAKDYTVSTRGTFELSDIVSVFGTSGVFNGTDTVVAINDLDTIYFGKYDFTIDFWVFVDTYPTGSNKATFVCKGHAYGVTYRSFALGIDSAGYLYISALFTGNSTTNTVSSIYKLNTSEWYHIAIVRHLCYMTLYVNGVSVYNWLKTDAVYTSTDDLCIGAQHYAATPTYNSYFNGYIDEFRVVLYVASWLGPFTPPTTPYLNNIASYRDARWIKISLKNGSTVQRLDYLGIYPNTETVYCPGGGLNCEWDLLGKDMNDYSTGEYDVISRYATISGSSTFLTSYPENVALPKDTSLDISNCWGFLKSDPQPTLYIELHESWFISELRMYHGTGNDEDGYYISSYTVYTAPTSSGEYSQLLTKTGNTSYITEHTFDAVEVQRVKLVVNSYKSGNMNIYMASSVEGQVQPELTPVVADGGFINEIELLSSSHSYILSSNNYPRICVNLEKQYHISRHGIVTSKWHYPSWENAETRFKYSNNTTFNPNLVSFKSGGGEIVYYSTSQSFVNYWEETYFLIHPSIYLVAGSYEMRWESLGVTVTEKLKVLLSGKDTEIEMRVGTLGEDWTAQSTFFSVGETGFYTLEAYEDSTYDDINWGIRNIEMVSGQDLVQWVQVEMNAATSYYYGWKVGHPYSDQPHFMTRLYLFAAGKITPTSHYLWWRSNISTLSSDYINTLVDQCSLSIAYPAAVETDWVIFLEGDFLGMDRFWMEQDLLCFNLFIDNIDNLDTEFGGIGFGNVDGKYTYSYGLAYTNDGSQIQSRPFTRAAYGWDISRLNLHSGWNRVRLRFIDWNTTTPVTEPGAEYLNPDLDLKNYIFASFGIIYRGKGNPLTLKIEDLRIERNTFDTQVMYGKGVCLSFSEYVDIPVSGISLSQGSIEMTLCMYNSSSGLDYFGRPMARTLFTLINSNNDLISVGVASGAWFEISIGNALGLINKMGLMDNQTVNEAASLDYGEPFVLGLSWSSDASGFSNGDTLRLFLNGVMVARWTETWTFDDYRVPSLVLGGGTCTTALNVSANGSAIFEIIKLYNYCKSTFDVGSLSLDKAVELDPNDYVYISKDNVNFHNRLSTELPFSFLQVQPGEKVPIYIKVYKDENTSELKKFTGELMINWHIAV